MEKGEQSAYVKFAGKYNSAWFRVIFDRIIKKIPLKSNWEFKKEDVLISPLDFDSDDSVLDAYIDIQSVSRVLVEKHHFLRKNKTMIVRQMDSGSNKSKGKYATIEQIADRMNHYFIDDFES